MWRAGLRPASLCAGQRTGHITVGDLRGKVLVLSRDNYATKPVGGFITGWGHQADYVTGSIKGPNLPAGTLYVQDFYEVMDKMASKLNGIEKLLDFSTKNIVNKNNQHLTVCVNCTSGYTASASTDGIRDNAVQCNKKVVDYLNNEAYAGPTGIIFMDFAGTDKSDKYNVKGLELVNAIIGNNQRYTPVKNADNTGVVSPCTLQDQSTSRYDLMGRKSYRQAHCPSIVIERGRKVVVR